MPAKTGKLLVSTKANSNGRKTVILVISAIFIIFGIFLLLNFDIITRIDDDYGFILGIVGIAFLFGYPALMLSIVFLGSKSYCDVYENVVSGRTALSINNPKAPMQDFEVTYDDIQNITETHKRLIIYTQYASYEVLAMRNCSQAVQEIRQKISKKH